MTNLEQAKKEMTILMDNTRTLAEEFANKSPVQIQAMLLQMIADGGTESEKAIQLLADYSQA